MGHTYDIALALGWLSPILLGLIVAFVLSRFGDNESSSSPARKERNVVASDPLHQS